MQVAILSRPYLLVGPLVALPLLVVLSRCLLDLLLLHVNLIDSPSSHFFIRSAYLSYTLGTSGIKTGKGLEIYLSTVPIHLPVLTMKWEDRLLACSLLIFCSADSDIAVRRTDLIIYVGRDEYICQNHNDANIA